MTPLISTRSVDDLVRTMGLGISMSQVSRLCAKIDGRVRMPMVVITTGDPNP